MLDSGMEGLVAILNVISRKVLTDVVLEPKA